MTQGIEMIYIEEFRDIRVCNNNDSTHGNIH